MTDRTRTRTRANPQIRTRPTSLRERATQAETPELIRNQVAASGQSHTHRTCVSWRRATPATVWRVKQHDPNLRPARSSVSHCCPLCSPRSGRDTVLCIQGNRVQAVKWRQRKMHLFHQRLLASTWTPYNVPHLFNLEWDPREEHQVDFPTRLGVPLHGASDGRVPEDARGRAAH